jgi:Fe-Mn family superoxide dismutase|tara:strand:- start:181 stop:807 length:627 start_codon:yes stop_codon:yes gene_type:complete
MSFLEEVNLILEKVGPYKPINLPYKLNALEPVVNKQTTDFHFNKHYKGYVKKLNAAMGSRRKIPLVELVKNINKYNDKVRDNAGGAYNHQLFFNMMKPGGSDFNGEIADRIKKRFGTYAKFKKEFIENAASQFGSGWGWLVEKNGRLDLAKTPNQDNPLMHGMGKPVLGVDVWEHSYYLMYGPDRKEWLSKFFDIVNWDFCSALLHTS